MKNGKRIAALFLSLSLSVSGVTACGGNGGTTSSISSTGNSSAISTTSSTSSSGSASSTSTTSSTSSTSSGSEGTKEEAALTATSVTFSNDGQYKTTVTSDTLDLSGVSAENTEVTYQFIDPIVEAMTLEKLAASVSDEEASKEEDAESGKEGGEDIDKDASVEENAESGKDDDEEADQDASVKAAAESGAEEDEEELSFEAVPVKVQVDSVEANPDGGVDITFTDLEAETLRTGNYNIFFTGLNAGTVVSVDFPEVTLTPDIEYVTTADDKFKVTLTVEGDEFAESLSKKHIDLGNNFKKLKIASLSKSGKNLTMQLKGKLVENEAGIYQWGEISIDRDGFKNGYSSAEARIDIKNTEAFFDRETLKYADGKATADLRVLGVADIDKLTNENVKIEGVTTEAVEKIDDTTVKVTMSVEQAGNAGAVENANAFADLVSGKEMTVDKYTTYVGLSQADFYPVFDYIEEDGDDFRLTLKLYAIAGTFDDGLGTDAVSFGDGLADAKVDSVERDSDTVATLILTTPVNGQKLDAFSIEGTVMLAPGALVNAWGEKTDKDVSFFREYANESLGKGEVTLNTETLLEIQKYCAGKDTFFGQLISFGSTASTVAGIATSVLQMAGLIKSDQTQIMEQLAEINRKVDAVLANQATIRTELMQLNKRDSLQAVSTYESYLNRVVDHTELQFAYIRRGALYMACEKAVSDGKLAEVPKFTGLSGQALKDALQSYEQYLPDAASMTNEEAAEYNVKLMKYITDRMKNGDTEFMDFNSSLGNLKDAIENMANLLLKGNSENPMKQYDQIASVCYNFDTQSYDYRLTQRVIAEAVLIEALEVLNIRQEAFNNPADLYLFGADGTGGMSAKIAAAVNQINNMPVTGLQAGEVRNCIQKITRTVENEEPGRYISDIMVSGEGDSAEAAKRHLTDRGYTIIDKDLNNNAGGHYIYLGYRTTTNINDAISGLYIRIGEGKNQDTFKSSDTYFLCPYVGSESFCAGKGDLNHRAGGSYLYLYYTKESNKNYAITGLSVKGEKGDYWYLGEVDLNKGAGGSDLFLHEEQYRRSENKYETVGTDPKHYPFSYVLGKKVAITALHTWDIGLKASDFNDTRVRALRNPDGSWRNWDDAEINEFLSRMRGNNLNEELMNAGFAWARIGLLTKLDYTKEFGYLQFWQRGSGSIIKMDSKQNTYFEKILTADSSDVNIYEYINFFLLYD